MKLKFVFHFILIASLNQITFGQKSNDILTLDKFIIQEELKAHHEEFIKKGKEILSKLKESAETKEKRKALQEAEIPGPVIDELAPEEKEK